MHAERLTDDVTCGHARIERGEGILEHDLHRAAHRAQLALAERRDLGAVELDAARGRLDQPQHGARDCGFAAAGFADEAERLAHSNRKTDAIHRMHGADLAAQHAAAHRVMLDEVLHLEQGSGLAHDAFASSAARQQAARWWPPKSCSGGYSWRQRSIASGQRGAKAQPSGRLVSDGTMPGISVRRTSVFAPSEITAGIEAIRPRV